MVKKKVMEFMIRENGEKVESLIEKGKNDEKLNKKIKMLRSKVVFGKERKGRRNIKRRKEKMRGNGEVEKNVEVKS